MNNVYVGNIEKETLENENFRKVLFTSHYSQLVVMSLKPGEDIGKETHGLDQFIRIEKGTGKAVLDGKEYEIEDDWAIVIPSGTEHNVVNTSDTEVMKIYTIYTPPEHNMNTVHATKSDAEEEHFDGKTSV